MKLSKSNTIIIKNSLISNNFTNIKLPYIKETKDIDSKSSSCKIITYQNYICVTFIVVKILTSISFLFYSRRIADNGEYFSYSLDTNNTSYNNSTLPDNQEYSSLTDSIDKGFLALLINNSIFTFLFITELSIYFIVKPYCRFNSANENGNEDRNYNSSLFTAFSILVINTYSIVNVVCCIMTKQELLVSYSLIASFILNSSSIAASWLSKYSTKITLINLLSCVILFFLAHFVHQFSSYNSFQKMYLFFFLLLFLFFERLYNKKQNLLYNKIKQEAITDLLSYNKHNIVYFEELIQNMSAKFVCFSDNMPVYFNKSYKESVDRHHETKELEKEKERENELKNITNHNKRKPNNVNIPLSENVSLKEANPLKKQSTIKIKVKETNYNDFITEREQMISRSNSNNNYTNNQNFFNNINKNKNNSKQDDCFEVEDENRPISTLPNNLLSNKKTHNEKSFNSKNISFLHSLIKYNSTGNSQIITLQEMLLDLMNYNTHDENKEFMKLGIFCNQASFKSFFEVFVRNFNYENKKLLEVMMHEVTEVKESEKISAENKYKQKIFSKIAHEFKTPLNNIISISNTISDHNTEIKEGSNDILETTKMMNSSLLTSIKNLSTLSNYTYQNQISSFNINKDTNSNNNMNANNNQENPYTFRDLESPKNNLNMKRTSTMGESSINSNMLVLNNLSSSININNNYLKQQLSSICSYINAKVNNNSLQIYKLNKMIISLANLTIYQVNDLINYSHNFDFGLIKMAKESISLKEIMMFSFEILETLIYCFADRAEKVKPILFIDPQLETMIIKTDEDKIKQVVLNLMTNAVKFTKSGSITLSAELEHSDLYGVNNFDKGRNRTFNSEKNCILLKVSDTGLGFKESEMDILLKKIEEKFSSQIDDNDYMNSKGTGFGLFICKSICRRLNYGFELNSNFNKGSTFTIRISDNPHKDQDYGYSGFNYINYLGQNEILEEIILSLSKENIFIKEPLSPAISKQKTSLLLRKIIGKENITSTPNYSAAPETKIDMIIKANPNLDEEFLLNKNSNLEVMKTQSNNIHLANKNNNENPSILINSINISTATKAKRRRRLESQGIPRSIFPKSKQQLHQKSSFKISNNGNSVKINSKSISQSKSCKGNNTHTLNSNKKSNKTRKKATSINVIKNRISNYKLNKKNQSKGTLITLRKKVNNDFNNRKIKSDKYIYFKDIKNNYVGILPISFLKSRSKNYNINNDSYYKQRESKNFKSNSLISNRCKSMKFSKYNKLLSLTCISPEEINNDYNTDSKTVCYNCGEINVSNSNYKNHSDYFSNNFGTSNEDSYEYYSSNYNDEEENDDICYYLSEKEENNKTSKDDEIQENTVSLQRNNNSNYIRQRKSQDKINSNMNQDTSRTIVNKEFDNSVIFDLSKLSDQNKEEIFQIKNKERQKNGSKTVFSTVTSKRNSKLQDCNDSQLHTEINTSNSKKFLISALKKKTHNKRNSIYDNVIISEEEILKARYNHRSNNQLKFISSDLSVFKYSKFKNHKNKSKGSKELIKQGKSSVNENISSKKKTLYNNKLKLSSKKNVNFNNYSNNNSNQNSNSINIQNQINNTTNFKSTINKKSNKCVNFISNKESKNNNRINNINDKKFISNKPEDSYLNTKSNLYLEGIQETLNSNYNYDNSNYNNNNHVINAGNNNFLLNDYREISSGENSDLDRTQEEKNIELDSFFKVRSNFLFGKKWKILVVDDTPYVLKATSRLISKIITKKSLMCEVIQARDGIDTLKFIMEDQKENLIKIVFTDEHMELMNGSESVRFVKRLEKEGKIKKVQFVSVTCFTDEITKSNIESAGMDYVIQKPISESKMEETIMILMDFKKDN